MIDFLHVSRSFRKTFAVRASEWALAIMLVNWSLVLFANPELFADRESYAPLQDIMRQETWALVCFAAGAGRLIVLMINGAWRRSPHLRAAGAFIACFFWSQITLGFAQSEIWGTGMAIYPVLFALDAYNVFRAITDAAIIDNHFNRAVSDGPANP
ncbi:hypothetical protein [Hoeflea sp. EC-HK425]|uniref:hypothetical protein n=1 Tax=Hoeflea sp. EC-HK425 TaxID=2038388 RepID=UPI00125C1C12|nr:hypothetical protein [Hoeflea sp. EC-HK425]VVT14956.1 conserved membrane hypothetical protein [Hoeflea sp. EC-HK425]